jgi:hypothetical protein
MKKGERKAFKLLRRYRGGLYSLSVRGVFQLAYRRGETTTGLKGTPVFIYRNVWCALSLALTNSLVELWEGVATGVRLPPKLVRDAPQYEGEEADVLWFWKYVRESRYLLRPPVSWPTGTFIADSFRPTKLIKVE